MIRKFGGTMPPISWEDLQRLGWAKHQNIATKRTYYTRPNSQTKLYQKRHLTEEERFDYGETLFPGRGKIMKVSVSSAPYL